MTEPRPPIFPAEWLFEDSTPSAATDMQDGILDFYLSQLSDWKVEKKLNSEPFDFRDHLSRWAQAMALMKFKPK